MAEFLVNDSPSGTIQSPGGFEFGLQGWNWADPVPKSITFFLDNTVLVADQYGRPIRGVVINGKELWFANCPPEALDRGGTAYKPRLFKIENKKEVPYATHAQTIAALTAEHIDWRKLASAGWPQLPYAELKKLAELPPTPLEELRKIQTPQLRKDALRIRREVDEMKRKEFEEENEDEEEEEKVATTAHK